MFLACDIGNSFIKIAVFDKDDLIFFKKYSAGEFSFYEISNYEISDAAISSVVPKLNFELREKIESQFKVTPLIVNHDLNFRLNINYNPKNGLGIDRICASEGAYSIFKSKNENPDASILVIDCGTATTFNLVSSSGVYKGGIIMPGIETMFASLNQRTAQLPQISGDDLTGLIADDTKGAIASGVIYSTIALIEKVYVQIKTESGDKPVLIFITGGNSKYISQNLSIAHEVIDDLVLRGIKSIYELNCND